MRDFLAPLASIRTLAREAFSHSASLTGMVRGLEEVMLQATPSTISCWQEQFDRLPGAQARGGLTGFIFRHLSLFEFVRLPNQPLQNFAKRRRHQCIPNAELSWLCLS